MTDGAARVVALFRHPVKGFAPQRCDSLEVAGGRVVGDRVLGVRYADAEAGDGWGPKREMVVGMNAPAIARLSLTLDHGRVRLARGADVLAETEVADAGGRDALARTLGEQPEVGLPAGSPHLPLRLVGDGSSARLHDSSGGHVTLHGRASADRLAEVLGVDGLDDERFRSNIVVEGIEPLAELAWTGRQLTVGSVRFRVRKPLVRCLMTHANPRTGERDLRVMQALTRGLGLSEPIFGISLQPLDEGSVRLGDELVLDDVLVG